uniref:Protein kinase domain-containing protein n=1 Tax=Physcomitrium patens TaxID=3218 RepID=A0A7I4A2V3_PHYPA
MTVMAASLSFPSPSTVSLRSSLFRPCLIRRDSQLTYRILPSRLGSIDPGRCVAQISVAGFSEALQSGLGPEAYQSMTKLYNDVFVNYAKLGVHLPDDENAVGYLAVALPAALLYLTATPGPIAGLLDFVRDRADVNRSLTFRAHEVKIGRLMGEGSFGIAYEGFIHKGGKRPGKQPLHVVLKKNKARVAGANQMLNAEIHMNQRLQRTSPEAIADFLGTVNVSSSQARGKLTEGVWLVWKYQGHWSLDHYMKQKNFPENIAEAVLGQKVKNTASRAALNKQNALVVRKIMQQILTNLRDLHRSGVVHRDLKPLNLVLSEDSGFFKLIDLGACVDIRSGFNYDPFETVIDPTYAAPEHYVMPTSTPTLPPDPLCSMISPLVWFLNTPDRFDLYSAGLILMQLCVKQLRQDVGLVIYLKTFSTQFKRDGYDLDVWRKRCSISSEEFAVLDADDGAGWELAKAMLQPRHDKAFFIWPSLRSSRPSAAAALRHRFIRGTFLPRRINIASLAPDITLLPSLPSLPSLSQLLRPVFSGESAKEAAVKQLTNLREASGNINPKRVIIALGAALPTAATSAFVLTIGWVTLATLKSSTHISYELGRSVANSVGLSGSACLVFFLFIKPRLKEHELASRREMDMQSRLEAEESTLINVVRPDPPVYNQTKLPSTGQQHGPLRFKTGLSEAVLAMEASLASLESSIQREQEFSAEQQERLARMKKLLITPSGISLASPSEAADVPLSTNGANVGKPFSEYIS